MDAKTYFKTEAAFSKACLTADENGYFVKRAQVDCACGKCPGAYLFDDDDVLSDTYILCGSCYRQAGKLERGE